MWILFLTSVLCGLISESQSAMFLPETELDELLQVKLPVGTVQGSIRKTRDIQMAYLSFEGIPYARPPVKRHRFKAPRPTKWKHVLNAANRKVPLCVQLYTPFYHYPGSVESEDCLYMNVYIPNTNLTELISRNSSELLPVMVWIHGGAFLTGIPHSSYFGPDYLLEQNVIVVHFGYRVNVFGFLSTEDEESPGNYGLKDQQLALIWINSNIGYFGGDPNKVTLFGESAGAVSIQYHLLYPKNQGLFRNVIMQSGSALSFWGLYRKPRALAFQIGKLSGLTTNNATELLNHLRGLTSHAIKMAAMFALAMDAFIISNSGISYFAPTLEPNTEDAYITYKTYEKMKEGSFIKVPCIIGLNSKESYYGQNAADIVNPWLDQHNIDHKLLVPLDMNVQENNLEKVGDQIQAFYAKYKSMTKSEQYLEYFNDVYFVNPILETAKLFASHSPTYLYNFTYDGYLGKAGVGSSRRNNIEGAEHTEEMWYIWARSDLKQANKSDEETRFKMVKMWTNFAKYNNPMPGDLNTDLDNITWLAMTGESSNYNYLDIGKVLTFKENTYNSIKAFWDSLYNKYGNPPFDTY